jgi:hypothetical protein
LACTGIIPSDTTPPTTIITLSGALCGTASIGPVIVEMIAFDDGTPPADQGITAIYYSINSGVRVTYHGSFSLFITGTYTIQAYAIDDAGNTGQTVTQVVTIVAGGACTSSGNACGDTNTGAYMCMNT